MTTSEGTTPGDTYDGFTGPVTASAAVARATGFRLTDAEPTIREGARYSLLTWQHESEA